jgi:arginyl-tRNA synthetase
VVAARCPGADLATVLIRPCPDPRFGDYQTNALIALAKERRLSPRALAAEIAAALDVADVCERVDVAGPGFLNFHVRPEAIARVLQEAIGAGGALVGRASAPRTVVVDFSSPNVAKPMHVGHIRSTILGDCLARALRLLGHRVITDNHLGDWGTAFGKLIVGWKQRLRRDGLEAAPLDELERLYREINFACELTSADLALIQSQVRAARRPESPAAGIWNGLLGLTDEEFASRYGGDAIERLENPADRCIALLARTGVLGRDHLRQDLATQLDYLAELADFAAAAQPPLLDQARQELVKLQDGDPENLEIWRQMLDLSRQQFDRIYTRLGVQFDQTLGESFYNPRLKAIVAELVRLGIAQESDGAQVVCFPGDTALTDHALIVQKSDGAANYATTDLATLAHRLATWQPDEIIYVTDGRQQLHFKQVFAAFRRWHPEVRARLAHVWFGSILGDDGRPFKTRSGDTVRLADLLDEAEERAFKVVSAKNPDLAEGLRRDIARAVGLGAVKYQDLLPNRQTDYVFSWDKMLALSGNTAPYLQYAWTRVRSIFRKLAEAGEIWEPATVAARLRPEAPEELRLAKHLLNFSLTIEAVVQEYRPNYLCNYLYELAGHFTAFYEACPVLKAAEPVRSSRLALCDLTARVLAQGLAVLGIETPDRM